MEVWRTGVQPSTVLLISVIPAAAFESFVNNGFVTVDCSWLAIIFYSNQKIDLSIVHDCVLLECFCFCMAEQSLLKASSFK
jgi:riboflavin synthase alpha subunit